MHRGTRTRGTRAALALGVLLSTLAACGGSDGVKTGASPPTSASTETSSAVGAPGAGTGSAGSPSAGPTYGSPAPTPGESAGQTTPTEGAGQPDLSAFLAACAQNVETWRPGQLRFTKRMSIPLHQSRTYRAQVDIQPGAQDQPSPDANTSTAGVQVKCGVAARLVPLSDDVAVDDGQWVLRSFDQPAVVQWDWSVRAVTTHASQVRLELRPAIADAEGRHIIPAPEDNSDLTMSGDTDVTVVATRFQRFYQWWNDNWGPLEKIAGALGVAVLAALTWVGKVRGWFSRTPSAPDPAPPVHTKPPTPRTPESPGRKPVGSGRNRGRSR